MEQQTQLTAKQIQSLFEFTTKNHVQYTDVKYELVDHLASGIEEQMIANPAVDFDTALKREFRKFPLTGFYHFVEQKEKALQKYWSRKIWVIIKNYLRIPQVLLTLSFFVGAYFFYLNFKTETTVIALFALSIAIRLYFINYRKKSKYLFIKQFYVALNATQGFAAIFFYFPEYGFNPFTIQMKMPVQMAALFYAVSVSSELIFLTGAVTGQYQRLLEKEIQTKYAHLRVTT